MPRQEHIETLSTLGLPVTVDGPQGWSHSQEYFRLRYGGMRELRKLLEEQARGLDVEVAGRARAALKKLQPQ